LNCDNRTVFRVSLAVCSAPAIKLIGAATAQDSFQGAIERLRQRIYRSEPGARSWSGTDWPGSGLQLVPRYSLGRHDSEPIVLWAATLDQQSEPGGTGAIAQERDRGRNALELPVCRLDQDRV
jgi:hypothetical protein